MLTTSAEKWTIVGEISPQGHDTRFSDLCDNKKGTSTMGVHSLDELMLFSPPTSTDTV
jgi:hypothetical protein